jgi:hypothetical protein
MLPTGVPEGYENVDCRVSHVEQILAFSFRQHPRSRLARLCRDRVSFRLGV